MSRTNKYDTDVTRLHGMGWRQANIAKELGITQPYVSCVLKRVGLRSEGSSGKYDDRVAELYQSGMTVRDVAATLKIATATVMRALKRKRVTTRRPGAASILNEEETASILEQSRNGVSASDLAEQFNCSRKKIYNIRHRNKLKAKQ